MKKLWSIQLTNTFNITLSSDLTAWFDQELWKQSAAAEFGCPISPEEILDIGSFTISGGAMLPDTLPILANGMGDVIAVRFNSAGAVRELLRWNHETSTWTPYGQSLCEALLLDAAVSRLSGEHEAGIDDESPFTEWAIEQMDICPERRTQLKEAFAADKVVQIEDLIACGIAEVGGRKLLAEAYLETALLKASCEIGGMAIAERVGVDWRELSVGLFDSQLIPQEHRHKLAELLEVSIDQLLFQDWSAAAKQATEVVSKRTDLAWPYAVLGRIAEQNGTPDPAFAYYLSGVQAMGTTADFTEAWSQQTSCPSKYCAQRLLKMGKKLPEDASASAYIRAATNTELYSIFEYWRAEAESAENRGCYDLAYDCWYHAGWDEYAFDDMKTILDGLVRTAQAAGHVALYELARHHKRTLV